MTHTTTNNNLELQFWVVNHDPQFQDLCVPWQSPSLSLSLSLSLLQQGLGGLFSLALRAPLEVSVCVKYLSLSLSLYLSPSVFLLAGRLVREGEVLILTPKPLKCEPP